MPAAFPHQYEVSLKWTDTDRSDITSGDRPAIGGGPAPQFDGQDLSRWSPEHLILAALGQCLMLTWIAMNKRSAIPLKSWESKASSTLDKTHEGLVFTALKLHVRLATDADRVEEARRLLAAAKKYCIIANSLKSPVDAEFDVVAA